MNSGHPGSKQIEGAIAKHYDPERYKVAWYINARQFQTVPALPHVHLWVVDKDGKQMLDGTNGKHRSEDSLDTEERIVVPS